MKFIRWAIVGFVLALALFSFFHLISAGSSYKILTTSDSGYFYGIAREINRNDGMIDKYSLSHPPQGKSVALRDQFQPLMLVMFYRGMNFLDPNIQLMDVASYFAPFLFVLALIGAFMAGREMGGDAAGCASAFFLSTLTGPIYWAKVGAFDREISLIFFGTWSFYLLAKLFKSKREDVLKYSIILGIFYGLFLMTWKGGMVIAAIMFGGLLFALLSKFPSHYTSVNRIEDAIYRDIRENRYLIGGVVGALGIATIMAVGMGGWPPSLWAGFSQRIQSFIGIGGGGEGISFPIYATEMQPPRNYFSALSGQLYGNALLMNITFILVAFGAIMALWSHRRWELLALAWLIIVPPMATDQSRFFRLFWPMWPILAGFGFGVLVWISKKALSTPELASSNWTARIKHPIALALVFVLLIAPFVDNAQAHATKTRPVPHGGSLPTVYYHSLLESFQWLRENTPENSIVAIEWSYGHFLTGAAKRASVTDGAETKGEEGVWQETSTIKPPDYIWRRVDHSAKFIGGRRPDMQDLYYTSNENEFAQIIRTYRDNYDIKIDYVVFCLWKESIALNANISNAREFEGNSVGESGQLIYISENENVEYYGGSTAYLQKDETLIPIRVVFYDVTKRRITGWSSFNPQQYAHKTLLVFHSGGKIITDDNGIPEVRLADQNLPMLTKIRFKYELPDYLEEVCRPRGYATVCKIIHENLPPA